ncbi:hypothetical protein CCHL11_01900 [Colletotrichum chlorophyti]|uniref:Glycoprotease family protein n=1 Tax=Colletotrichum chlorophyti TaxID=708187 RepID=A0A1Q8RW16_9PEZI|nr:hypothetical protein CCHL11_01900 [Colletotrichum chlorophyti]
MYSHELSASKQPKCNRRTEPEREEWEDWEDDDVVTPIVDDEEGLFINKSAAPSPLRPNKPPSTRYSQPRHSIQKLKRLKSRQRQKAQNAKAGIKVVTDMTKLRQQQGFQQNRSLDPRRPKFVDAAALRALEGSPNSASVGSWNWLKKRPSDQNGKSPQSAVSSTLEEDLSPNDRPIVIGIALPSEMADRELSPQTAVIETPHDLPPTYQNKQQATVKPNAATPLTPSQQKSVWSPDTPDTTSPFQSPHRSSSIYSQATGFGAGIAHDAPPVPLVPSNYKQQERVVSIILKDDNEDDDGGSPCTLFEEDGVASTRGKSTKAKEVSKSPDSAATQTRGWWDHITTPFLERKSPTVELKSESQLVKPSERDDWWSEKNTKGPTNESKDSKPTITNAKESKQVVVQRPGLPASPKPSPRNVQTPIVKIPTPRRTPSPLMDRRDPSPASSRSITPRPQVQTEKVPLAQPSPAPSEQPPPYSPPQQQKAVRYRAVFPAGHPLQALYPQSPGPISPAINGTMSSQGSINMTDIPLTPAPRGAAPAQGSARLPDRFAGTFVPQEHFLAVSGDAHRVERQRQRHEKEEFAARKVGGFWKGRWCIPASGCYGRNGREGRKRRRVCLGVCGASLLLSILVIVLCVTLVPRSSAAARVDGIFVNLTNFPPMPTGVLSVVGPDNTAAVTGCSSPSTVWSCALPKEEHESVAPYRPNQPTFIMQIQWDNNTRNLWNVPNGEAPRPGTGSTKRDSSLGGIIARAGAYIRRQTSAFEPNPAPPSFEEMYFLGNTTDGIISDDKGGEPTPFYLSILRSVNETFGPNALDKRQATDNFTVVLPPPDLQTDGTGAPAQLFPYPVQQPVRLYDRGLPTEHYGFYTYFKRTIYLKSVTSLNGTDGETNVPLDKDGGSRRSEANFLVTWSQTRFLVQIWTRSENSTQLLGNAASKERHGTMPYPVTIKTDTHGGQSGEKFVWHWPVDDRQGIDTTTPKLLPNDIGFGGTTVNPRRDRDASFGGFDGGTGGCRCEWVNFVNRRDAGA